VLWTRIAKSTERAAFNGFEDGAFISGEDPSKKDLSQTNQKRKNTIMPKSSLMNVAGFEMNGAFPGQNFLKIAVFPPSP